MLKFIQWLLAKEGLLRRLGPLMGAFNPFQSEHRRDPHSTWKRLRETQPIFFSRIFGAYFVTRYDDCLEVLRNPAASADRRDTAVFRMVRYFNRNEPEFLTLMERNLLGVEGSDHRRLRGLINKAFTPRRIQELRPRLQKTVEGLLDQAASQGQMDLVADYAYPFPVIAIAELLGVPAKDHLRFRAWTADLVQILDPFQGKQGAEPMRRATRELFDYFRPLLAERRAEPRDDLLSAMIVAEEDGDQLDEGDLLALCALVLAAGHETTANLIGNAVVALLRNPEQLKRLTEDPSLMPLAVEEFLRFDPPIQFTDRAIVEDWEFAGHRFKKGQFVAVLLASANRDPEHFSDPDQLDVGRVKNPHLSFSHGSHFCLGAQLARMEAELAIGTLLQRFPDFTGPAEPSDWRRSMILRGPVALPLNL